ncbi:MAG: helix-turn-helix domain-containing protein [Chitinophagaceae bacterium]|nr:helix-turn-helix domain-containing protein [Chitinophagaceae bacterium]
MESTDIQTAFFHHIRSMLPPHLSMPEQVAELLDLSTDSAYRRIRGEKMLSFEEIKILCSKFNLSLDQLLNLDNGTVLFSGHYVTAENFRFESYLGDILNNLETLNGFESREMIYMTKDIPVFYYLMIPDITAFKFFVWMKTQFQFADLKQQKFSFDIIKDEWGPVIKKICLLYTEIPGAEIFNPDNILNDMRQLEYYKDAGIINNSRDLERIYDAYEKMMGHMENQATEGKKFLHGEEPGEKAAAYRLYVNDFFVGDNNILATVNNNRVAFVNHNAINFISTTDKQFCDYTWRFIQNIIRRSTLISQVGERARTRFFNLIRERIQAFRENRVKTLGNF